MTRSQPKTYWSSRFATSRLSSPELFARLLQTNVFIPSVLKDDLLAIVEDRRGRLWLCQPADTLKGFMEMRGELKPQGWWLVPIYGPIDPAVANEVLALSGRHAA